METNGLPLKPHGWSEGEETRGRVNGSPPLKNVGWTLQLGSNIQVDPYPGGTRIKGGPLPVHWEEGYTLFSLTPFALFGGFNTDYLGEWVREFGEESLPVIVTHGRPLYSQGTRIQPDQARFVLQAIRTTNWLAFREYVGSSSTFDRKTNFVAVPVLQTVTWRPFPNSETIDLPVFGADTTRMRIIAEPSLDCTELYFAGSPPSQAVREVAATLFGELLVEPKQITKTTVFEGRNEHAN